MVHIWDLHNPKPLWEFETHRASVCHICFDPEGRRVATVSWDGTARVWDLTGKPETEMESGFNLRLMSSVSDVGGIPAEGKNLIVVVPVNNVLHFRIFDGDGKEVVDTDERKLTEQARRMEDLRKTTREPVASSRAYQERRGQDHFGCCINRRPHPGGPSLHPREISLRPRSDFSRAFRPDGQELATNQWDGVVHLWTPIESSRAKDQEDSTSVLETPGIPQMFATFSPDGDQIATVGFDNKIRLYPVQIDPLDDGRVRLGLPVEKEYLHDDLPLSCVAFDPSRTDWLATASYDRMGRLWFRDGNQLEEKIRLRGHGAQIYEIAYSPQEEIVATASMDGTVRFWNLSGKQKGRLSSGVASPIQPSSIPAKTWSPRRGVTVLFG